MDIKELDNGLLKTSLIVLLCIVGFSVACLVFSPQPPNTIVSLNDSSDIIATVAATACGLLCCPGFLCIFIKKLRFPMLIIASFVLLLFLSACCINGAYEALNYSLAKDKTPKERLCVITYHKENHSTFTHVEDKEGVFGNTYKKETTEEVNKYMMSFRFLDDGTEHSLSKDEPFHFYEKVYEGDTCVAYILTGAFGMDYVIDMRVKRRGR